MKICSEVELHAASKETLLLPGTLQQSEMLFSFCDLRAECALFSWQMGFFKAAWTWNFLSSGADEFTKENMAWVLFALKIYV